MLRKRILFIDDEYLRRELIYGILNLSLGKAGSAGVCKVLAKPLTRAELLEGLRGVF